MYKCSVTEECAGEDRRKCGFQETEDQHGRKGEEILSVAAVRQKKKPAQFVVGEWNGWMIPDLYRETIKGCEKN